MAELTKFYNSFHKGANTQFKIINEDNITYRIIISELISSFKLRNLNIFDYGCGVGALDLYLATRHNYVTGMDISDSAINLANKSKVALNLEKYCNFIVGTSSKYKTNNRYDLVICSEVIEHVKDDINLIKYLKSLLNPNGYIFISTPSLNSPLFKLGMLKQFDQNVGHLRRYSIEGLEKILTSNGFKAVFINKTEGILRNTFFTQKYFGFFLKFMKGPLGDIFTLIDNSLIPLFGESNLHVLAKKENSK